VWALIFTACYSRHCFVWLSFRQTTEAVITGFEAAWAFFGGVFAVVVPDNTSAIVEKADRIDPRLNQAFVEYAQDRGFVVDPARVRKPTDKPRVERVVPFARSSMFAGETFVDLAHAQRHAEHWCANRAGLRTHGTTQCRPAELFALEERPRLLPAPTAPYDLPIYATAKVHRDHHLLTELRARPRRAQGGPSSQPSAWVMTSTERASSSATKARSRRVLSNQARYCSA